MVVSLCSLWVNNMAAVCETAAMMIQKNSQILVNVEEALSDLLVVSYCTENKKFQGVLLDSNKCNLPFGVYSLHPAFSNVTARNSKNDKLHSASQRFTYQEPSFASENQHKAKKSGPKSKPQQRQKMTVRLRPRKVLCSNCKGICNENNENVDVSKKRKLESDDIIDNVPESSVAEKKYLLGGSLIPKLSRLHPSEISSALKGVSKSSIEDSDNIMVTKEVHDIGLPEVLPAEELAFVSVSDSVNCDKPDKNTNDANFNSLFSSARTLKICFGEGEGTVVKIPPITGDYNEDSGVACDMSKSDSKAAKKALKKAKKQARKNNPMKYEPEFFSEQQPKLIGALSPRNNQTNNSPTIQTLEKKQKHKVKHKKKCKLQKKRDENTSKCAESESINYFSDLNGCLKQKLSISLRRLSSNSYEKRNEQDALDSGSDGWESETAHDVAANDDFGGRISHVSPGDIVWGKMVGFPWWPGRVLSVTSSARAHVAWYASSTTSIMPFDSLSPFLEDYKIRFIKKKRGPYKEAVKQATIEAKKSESHIKDPLASPTGDNLGMSPHPIDVFS